MHLIHKLKVVLSYFRATTRHVALTSRLFCYLPTPGLQPHSLPFQTYIHAYQFTDITSKCVCRPSCTVSSPTTSPTALGRTGAEAERVPSDTRMQRDGREELGNDGGHPAEGDPFQDRVVAPCPSSDHTRPTLFRNASLQRGQRL